VSHLVANIWEELWGTSLSGLAELERLVQSYLEYLEDKLDSIESQIARRNIHIKITPQSLDYVSFVTLGPSLVNGLTLLRKMPKALADLFLEAVRKIPQNPQNWSGLIIRQLLSEMKVLPERYKPTITETFSSFDGVTSLGIAMEMVGQRNATELALAFLVAIIESKNWWDPPECTSAAANIIQQGFRQRVYANALRGLTKQFQITEWRGEPKGPRVIEKWSSMESDLRNRAFGAGRGILE
jgi:hypothetical protein